MTIYDGMSANLDRLGISRADWQMIEEVAKHAAEETAHTIDRLCSTLPTNHQRFLAKFTAYKFVSEATDAAMLDIMEKLAEAANR